MLCFPLGSRVRGNDGCFAGMTVASRECGVFAGMWRGCCLNRGLRGLRWRAVMGFEWLGSLGVYQVGQIAGLLLDCFGEGVLGWLRLRLEVALCGSGWCAEVRYRGSLGSNRRKTWGNYGNGR